MIKRLSAVFIAVIVISFSSISVYADDITTGYTVTDPEAPVYLDQATQLLQYEELNLCDDTEDNISGVVETARMIAEYEKAENRYKRGLGAYIRSVNYMTVERSERMASYFIKYADQYDMDEKVVMAMAQSESSFHTQSHNPAGYYGMMQLNAGIATGNGYKVSDLYKMEVNIKLGTRYLAVMKGIFGSNAKAIAAFMYGSGSVSKGYYSMSRVNKVLAKRTAIVKYLKKHGYTK